MQRIRTSTMDGKEILVLDYSELGAGEYKAMMIEAIRAIQARPEGSALTVTIVRGTRFSVGTTEDIKAYSRTIRPWMKASAVVGLSSLQKVIFATVKPFLSSRLEVFNTEAEAKVWLAKQA